MAADGAYRSTLNNSGNTTQQWWTQTTNSVDARTDASGDNRNNTAVNSGNTSVWSANTTNNDTNVSADAWNNGNTWATSSTNTSADAWNNGNTSLWSNANTSTVNNISTTDPGLVRIAELSSQLQGAQAQAFGDTTRVIAGFGADALKSMGAAATNINAQAGSNMAQAWGHTLDVAQNALQMAFDATGKATGAALSLAGSSLSTFQPIEAKTADTTKYALIGAACLVAVFLFNRKG